jgi:iron-regulated transporter 1
MLTRRLDATRPHAAGSLALVSAYGLLDDAARVASGGVVGKYVDTTERRAAACRLYALQHGCVAVSCAAAAAALACTGPARAVLACAVLASGACAGIGASGSSLSVEREWTKALHADDAAALTTLNARMRAVDLSCLLLAPIAAAGLLQLAGAPAAVLCFAAYNAVVYWPECRLLSTAQQAAPALQQPRAPEVAGTPAPEAAGSATANTGLRGTWAVYARQPVLPAAVALALLYLTVLSLGFLMTAYLHWCGVHDVVIAVFRAVGAAAGLSATAAFPRAARATRLPVIAAAAVAFQLLWLLIGVLPVSATSGGAAPAPSLLRLLMASIAISRAGLWMTDLAVSQVRAENAPAAAPCTANAAHDLRC